MTTAPQEMKTAPGKTAFAAAGKIAEQGANTAEIFSSLYAKANETLTDAASELYQCQRDMAESMTKNWRTGMDQRTPMLGYVSLTSQLQTQSEDLVASLRRANDAFRNCGWKLASLLAASMERAASQMNAIIPKAPAE